MNPIRHKIESTTLDAFLARNPKARFQELRVGSGFVALIEGMKPIPDAYMPNTQLTFDPLLEHQCAVALCEDGKVVKLDARKVGDMTPEPDTYGTDLPK